jgi:RNA polymerase sigma-70 factor, ECF subfamily
MAIIDAAPSLGAGDIGDLYGTLAGRLERLVRLDVRASDAVIEDACQAAWCLLLRHGDRVQRETVMAWLARTAVHEAFRSLRRCRREAALESADLASGQPPPEEVVLQRERLNELAALPARQRRLLWLHASGLSYAEMAAQERCTRRTVERQLLRARAALRKDDRAPDP